MKIQYLENFKVAVIFDDTFSTYYEGTFDKISRAIKTMFWTYGFDHADIFFNDEKIMTIDAE